MENEMPEKIYASNHLEWGRIWDEKELRADRSTKYIRFDIHEKIIEDKVKEHVDYLKKVLKKVKQLLN